MTRLALVRSDDAGLYVRAGGYTARPGNITGYDHAYRMDDGGLKAGDRVAARHIAQTPLVQLKLEDGSMLRWHTVPHPAPGIPRKDVPLPIRPAKLRRA